MADCVSFVLLSLVLEVTVFGQVGFNVLFEIKIPLDENDIEEESSGSDGDCEYTTSEDDLSNKEDEPCFDQ